MKQILFIGLIIAVVVGFSWLYDTQHQEHMREFALRAICEANQNAVYSALSNYQQEHGQLPSTLVQLVDNGYVDEERIYCPRYMKQTTKEYYKYSPENFGNPNLLVLSEDVDNHPGGWFLPGKAVEPVIIKTMGDGEIITRVIKETPGSAGG